MQIWIYEPPTTQEYVFWIVMLSLAIVVGHGLWREWRYSKKTKALQNTKMEDETYNIVSFVCLAVIGTIILDKLLLDGLIMPFLSCVLGMLLGIMIVFQINKIKKKS